MKLATWTLSIFLALHSIHATAQEKKEALKDEKEVIEGNQKKIDSLNSLEKERTNERAAWVLETSQSAKEYVDLIDRGAYEKSWSKGDSVFQRTISKHEWAQALEQNRKPLGKVISRKIKDQRLAMNPQNLPPGPYMVVLFDTQFEKGSSNELLTLRRGDGGVWRVLTYQVE